MISKSHDGSSMTQQSHGQQTVILHPTPTFDASEVSTTEIERVIERYKRQSMVQAAQKVKTAEAMELVNQLYRHRHISDREAFEFLEQLDDTVVFSDRMQKLYEESRLLALQEQLASIRTIVQLGVGNIKQEVARSLDRYPVARRRGGFGGIVANIGIGARIGLESPSGTEYVDVTARASEPRSRFDGLLIGEPGSDDEFGDLTNGPR